MDCFSGCSLFCYIVVFAVAGGMQMTGIFTDWWGIYESRSGSVLIHHGLIHMCSRNVTDVNFKCDFFNWSTFVKPQYSERIRAVMACSFVCAFIAAFVFLLLLATIWRACTDKSVLCLGIVIFISRCVSFVFGFAAFVMVNMYEYSSPFSDNYYMGWSYTIFWVGSFAEVALVIGLCVVCSRSSSSSQTSRRNPQSEQNIKVSHISGASSDASNMYAIGMYVEVERIRVTTTTSYENESNF